MNKSRRKVIDSAIKELAIITVRIEESGDRSNLDMIKLIYDVLSNTLYDEESAKINTPENLQNTERYQCLEDNTEYIEGAMELISKAQASIECASKYLNNSLDLLLSVQ